MENRYNLDAIPAHLKEKVSDRINAIEEFFASPGRRHAEQIAARLLLSVSQFYKLATKWRDKRDPLELIGGSRPRKRQASLDKQQLALIDEFVQREPHTPATRLTDMVIASARTQGLSLPSAQVIRRHIKKICRGSLPDTYASTLDLLIDFIVLDLPVSFHAKRAERPLAAIVIDVSMRQIVGLHLSAGCPNDQVALKALRNALERSRALSKGRGRSSLRIGVPTLRNNTDTIHNVLQGCGLDIDHHNWRRYDYGSNIVGLLGEIHNGIQLRPHLCWRTEPRHAPCGVPVMSGTEASAFIRSRFGIVPSEALRRISREMHTRLSNRISRYCDDT